MMTTMFRVPKSALISCTALLMMFSLPTRATVINFLDQLSGLVVDSITITKLGGAGTLDLSLDVWFMLDDQEITLTLDPDGNDTYNYTGFVDEFFLTEIGDGWLSNIDNGPDSTWGTKTYQVFDNNTAYGSCGFGDKCTWDIYITNVSIPAAAGLFGSALVGLGLVKRRKQAALARSARDNTDWALSSVTVHASADARIKAARPERDWHIVSPREWIQSPLPVGST